MLSKLFNDSQTQHGLPRPPSASPPHHPKGYVTVKWGM